MVEYGVLGHRIAIAAGRAKPYTASYMRNLLLGLQPMTAEVDKAANALTLAVAGRVIERYETVVRVKVKPNCAVSEDSLVMSSSRPCICGVEFIPRVPNQKYHHPLCNPKVGKRALVLRRRSD